MNENDLIRRCEAVKAVEYWTVEGVEAINRIPASVAFNADMCNEQTTNYKRNADVLRLLGDKQLAIFMASVDACPYDRDDALVVCDRWNGACVSCWLEWLKQEVESDG